MPTATSQANSGLALLKLLADTLGHTPADSIALLAIYQPQGITVHRRDLSPRTDQTAHHLLATLDLLPAPEALVLAGYADTDWAAAPHTHLLRIRDRLQDAGYPIRDTLISTRTSWGHAGRDDHPLPHRRATTTNPAVAAAFRGAYRTATARSLPRDIAGPAPANELVNLALTHPDLPALASLAAAIAIPARRPEILRHLAWGHHSTVNPLQLLEPGTHHLTAPDPERLAHAESLLRCLAGLTTERRARAGTLGMLGWVLAAQGRGTASARVVDHALSVDPDDELAGDLQTWLGAGNLPPWCLPDSGAFL